MKTLLLSLSLAALPFIAFAQTNAGDVPSGATLETINVSFSFPQDNMRDTVPFDLNCDGDNDILMIFDSGFPGIDAPRYLVADILNPNYSICATTTGTVQTQFYQELDPLSCSGVYDWDSSLVYFGLWGGWIPVSPFDVTDAYLAYTDGTNVGWINYSYDMNALPITLDVHEAITFCNTLSTPDPGKELEVEIFPNPVMDGIVQVQSDDIFVSYNVFNSVGQLVVSHQQAFTQIELPAAPGIYFVELTSQSGISTQRKIIRQ